MCNPIGTKFENKIVEWLSKFIIFLKLRDAGQNIYYLFFYEFNTIFF